MSRERVALLDVNLLVALFDPDHIHHELVHDWPPDVSLLDGSLFRPALARGHRHAWIWVLSACR